ncbi:Hypothetical predicted protein [Paramuricea clavata]|uniref:Uncharacterized protein n=1 Tax=Paramuricea clavata TaxID=317549 RepID=A0A7D9J3F9_PARCT|nr:Hypothetical predicted protein [Paramuricea clavata]
MTYASRPLSEFNKFEALDMVENLNNVSQEQKHAKHAYHRMVYQTLLAQMSVSTEQFRSLLLRLLGDKDHERIFDIVAIVEKRFQSRSRDIPQGSNVNTSNRLFSISSKCREMLLLSAIWTFSTSVYTQET